MLPDLFARLMNLNIVKMNEKLLIIIYLHSKRIRKEEWSKTEVVGKIMFIPISL